MEFFLLCKVLWYIDIIFLFTVHMNTGKTTDYLHNVDIYQILQ